MGMRIGNVGIDTNDLARATAFWKSVTGYQTSSEDSTQAWLTDPAKQGPGIAIQVVPEPPPAGKNRLHIDLFAEDLEGEVGRLKGLGASEVQRYDGWTVMSDPDGNQFCVCQA
jgi:predicted enzyme related to lactoylglutathione lyase